MSLRQNSPYWVILSLLGGAIFLFEIACDPQENHAGEVSVESLEGSLEGLLSPQCQIRRDSTNSFRVFTKKKDLNSVEKTLEQSNPDAWAYLRPMVHHWQGWQNVAPTFLKKMRQIYQATENEIPIEGNESAFSRAYLSALLANIEVRPLLEKAFVVGYVSERAHFYSHPQLYELGKEYEAALKDLFSSSDQTLQILAASGIWMGTISRSAEFFSKIVEGLNHPQFSLREIAFLAVQDQLPPYICYNPLDSEEERVRGIQKIKKWWQTLQNTNSSVSD